jgi:hypothetical protein
MFSSFGWAEAKIPVQAPLTVEIKSYDKAHRLYEVVEAKMEGQGPWYATASSLAKAIDAIQLKKIRRNPSSIVGNEYTTDHVLVLLPPDVIRPDAMSAPKSNK